MKCFSHFRVLGLIAAGLLLAVAPARAQNAPPRAAAIADYQARLAHYTQLRRAYDEQASVYWDAVVEKRRARNAKRRDNQPVELDDYVLTQPPLYSGPPRPVDPNGAARAGAGRKAADPGDRRFPENGGRAVRLRAAAPAQRTRVQEGLRAGRRRQRPDPRSDRRRLCVRDRRQRHLRHAGRRHAHAPARDLAGGRLQSVAQHQFDLALGRARQPPARHAAAEIENARRRRQADDGHQDRGAQAHDRLRPQRAEQLERARPAGQDHARAASACTRWCSTAISARCCRCRS